MTLRRLPLAIACRIVGGFLAVGGAMSLVRCTFWTRDGERR